LCVYWNCYCCTLANASALGVAAFAAHCAILLTTPSWLLLLAIVVTITVISLLLIYIFNFFHSCTYANTAAFAIATFASSLHHGVSNATATCYSSEAEPPLE